MPFVAILGAGPLGGALAYAMATRARFDEVRLIDPEQTLAAGKALDILQSGPVDGYSTRVTGHASLDAANGAWVTLLADPIQSDPLRHVGELHRRSPGAIVVCADASHRAPMARAVASGAVPPDRVVGSAPSAVASAARALMALDADSNPSEIHVSIVDGPAQATTSCAIDWTRTAIEGVPATTALRREQQSRIEERLSALWPPGPLTLGAVAARMAEAAWFGARQPFHGWWVTDGGASAPAVHVVRFAAGGRVRTVNPGTPAGAGLAGSGAGR